MFDNIFKYITDNGFGTVIGAVLLYFIIVLGNNLVKKIFPDKKPSHINSSIPLSEHPYFSLLEELMYYRINTFQFDSEKKKEVFTIYLKLIYKTALVRYKALVSDDRILNYSRSELKNKFTSEIRLITQDYNAKAIEIGIPKIVIDKFSEYIATIITGLVEEIVSIIDNPYYTSNYSRIFGVLNILKFTSVLLADNMSSQISKLNGDLEKGILNIKLLSIIL